MSNIVEFTIKKGCKLNVNVGNTSAETLFSWDNVDGATGYDVKIWKGEVWDGDPYLIEWGATNPFSTVLPEGTYQAYVDTRFDSDLQMSNIVEFTIEKGTLIKYDCNNDGEFSVADAVILQKWLLNDGMELTTWQTADLDENGIIDAFDLRLMKQKLVGLQFLSN